MSGRTDAPEGPAHILLKVISGGQSGVDRAALDAAMDCGLRCGGWCPKGRLAEDGPIPARYPLREAPTSNYPERTALNVRDSDGTLVLAWGPPAEGTGLTLHLAESMEKPCLVLDLRDGPSPESAWAWVKAHGIQVLNVAGPRASASPELYDTALGWLRRFLEG
jgi:hypothetical protein